jgi:Benzoyl-CoA reductase/2-hydroxyglutaryl-CoA dehydratase subunit, BcrC/BadD/HgdB
LPLSSADILKINLAAVTAPKDAFAHELDSFLKLLKEWLGSGSARPRSTRIPVHVSGSVVVDPAFFEIIDEAGGVVASDDLCIGTRYFWDEVPESKDPIEAIGQRYLNRVTCPSKYPAQNRPGFLLDRLKESAARGLIILGEKYCDPHLFDIPAVRTRAEAAEIPTLWLETELAATGREQLMVRFETFMDVLGRK